MKEDISIPDVLNRMYNWKMESAYHYALSISDFPKKPLKLLKQLSDKFGDCGWQFGSVFNELRRKNNKVAKLLGYKWDDKEDNWIEVIGYNLLYEN